MGTDQRADEPGMISSEGCTNEAVHEARMVDKSDCIGEDKESELLACQSIGEDTPHEVWAMKAQVDPATMYYHQAMREKDTDKFVEATNKEIQDQCKNGNFDVTHKDKMPDGTKPLPAVWQMRRKRNIWTGIIKKYKARLNLDDSKMVKGVDFDRTYAPVATWNAICNLLVMVLVGTLFKSTTYQHFSRHPSRESSI